MSNNKNYMKVRKKKDIYYYSIIYEDEQGNEVESIPFSIRIYFKERPLTYLGFPNDAYVKNEFHSKDICPLVLSAPIKATSYVDNLENRPSEKSLILYEPKYKSLQIYESLLDYAVIGYRWQNVLTNDSIICDTSIYDFSRYGVHVQYHSNALNIDFERYADWPDQEQYRAAIHKLEPYYDVFEFRDNRVKIEAIDTKEQAEEVAKGFTDAIIEYAKAQRKLLKYSLDDYFKEKGIEKG